MHKLIISIVTILFLFFASSDVFALNSGIVIKSVQLGNSAGASNEFIEIYNNSDTPVDITNWCIYYASAANDTFGAKISCIIPDNPNIHTFLNGRGTMLAVSNQYYQASGFFGDMRFDSTLSATAGHIRIVDSENNEIDKVAWGDAAVSPEGSTPALVPKNGQIISRKKISDDTLKDTFFNFDDFEIIEFPNAFLYGQIYEVQDICSNITEIQVSLPDGFSVDVDANCIEDQVDLCLNIDSVQGVVPSGYRTTDGSCYLDLLRLELSEMLPNPAGTDADNEFIELYNPNASEVFLDNYVLVVGADRRVVYFPVDSSISPYGYLSVIGLNNNFTLVNTIGGVSIESIDGQVIDDFVEYKNANDDMSWAKINGVWQYTNRSTPGSLNLESYIQEITDDSVDEPLQPCAPNQYRNPETNRCRLISEPTSDLVPCREGQYRSIETNRCRNIVSDIISLVPCAEGQERNPLTNRCRVIGGSVLGSSDLKPCKEGQERNPETNRCRNIKGAIVEADYKPKQVVQKQDNRLLIFSIIGIGILLVGYGIWEWRTEITKIFRKIKEKFTK